MFRPRLLLGIFLIGLGVFSYLLNPSWWTPAGIAMLIVVGILGGIAVAFDLRLLWQDVKKMEAKSKNDQDKV
jgi:hypothetical protein